MWEIGGEWVWERERESECGREREWERMWEIAREWVWEIERVSVGDRE